MVSQRCWSCWLQSIAVHLLLLLLPTQIEAQCHLKLNPILATDTEALHELERITDDLNIGEIKTRKREFCMIRQDAEIDSSDLCYCMELALEPNTSVKGRLQHFARYFKWLKLDVVNSMIPGDGVGPLGAQLTFGVNSEHVPGRGKHETVEEQLANDDVVMLLKEIFGSITLYCGDGYKCAFSSRNYRTLLLDIVLDNPRGNGTLLQLLSQLPFGSFMGSTWAEFDNLVGFWHEQLIFNDLEESQLCKYTYLASSNAEDTCHQCDRTSVLSLMLAHKSDFWHEHSTTQWLTKQFSLLLNHEEDKGLFVSYCEVGFQKSHSENVYMLVSDNLDPPSEMPQKCDISLCAELEMIVFQRTLVGKGAHRHLSSFMKLRYSGNYSSQLHHQFCEIVILERLQSGIFVDSFELQRLVHRGVLNAAYVYGDANLELPSQHSHQSIVEVHAAINADSGILTGNNFEFELTVDLPLHARYPPLSIESYKVVSISMPHVLQHCTYKNQITNLRTSRNIHRQENGTLSWVIWGRGTSHTSEVLKWRIPSGDPLHAKFVSMITAFSALVSVVTIILASLFSLQFR